MPDSPETRIGLLERQYSSLKTEVDNLNRDMVTMERARDSLIRLEEKVKGVGNSLDGLREVVIAEKMESKQKIQALTEEIESLRKENTAGRQASKTQIIVAALGIVTTVITVGGAILAAIITRGF